MIRLCTVCFGLFIALGMLAGCAAPINVHQLLQAGADEALYTQYNLHIPADRSRDIPAQNYKNAADFPSILPFGTAVKVTQATEDELVFAAVKSGETFTIVFNQDEFLISPQEYIRRFLGKTAPKIEPPHVSAAGYEKAKRGFVAPGMTRHEVLLAWGYPATTRSPNINHNTWIYEFDDFDTRRVVFHNDVVLQVLTLDSPRK